MDKLKIDKLEDDRAKNRLINNQEIPLKQIASRSFYVCFFYFTFPPRKLFFCFPCFIILRLYVQYILQNK